jgi:hypothetical protein
MCEHWLPVEIANVSLSFLLQMLHVKNINWTLRFGAVASEPANLFNVALANGHKRNCVLPPPVRRSASLGSVAKKCEQGRMG